MIKRLHNHVFRERAEYSGETISMSILRKRMDEVMQLRRNSPWHVFAAHPNLTLITLKRPVQ